MNDVLIALQQTLCLMTVSLLSETMSTLENVFYKHVTVALQPPDSCKPQIMNDLLFVSALHQDPNQLIRASALRVLSSIRVTIIVPIMMLAIKEAASDMSPYVRKTAAHAIPKLYR